MRDNSRKKFLVPIFVALIVILSAGLTACTSLGIFDDIDIIVDGTEYDITLAENIGNTSIAKDILRQGVLIEARKGAKYNHGSGAFIAEGGYIITNKHVVIEQSAFTGTYYYRNRYTDIKVWMQTEEGLSRAYSAEVVDFLGGDDIDIAVIRITDDILPDYQPVKLDADIIDGELIARSLEFGESLLTYGYNASTSLAFTSGRVGNPSEIIYKNNLPVECVRLDMPINHGNSGGGIYDSEGNYAGIVTYRMEGRTNAASSVIFDISYALSTEKIIEVLRWYYPDVYDILI